MKEFLDYFDDRCKRSKELTDEAKKYIPGGVQHNLAFNYPFPIAIEKNMTITFDDINLRNAIIFFGKELGKVEEISRRGSRIILPKLVGTYPLQIFYKDSVATFKITSGYSDVSKFISREDFRRNSQKIKRVVR